MPVTSLAYVTVLMMPEWAQPAFLREFDVARTAENRRMGHQFDAFAADALDKSLQPAVVIHVPVGKHQDLQLLQVHTQHPGIPKRALFGKAEVEERRPGCALIGQSDYGRKPMLGQDAHPIAGVVLRCRPLHDCGAVMSGDVDEIVLESEDFHFFDFFQANRHNRLLQ
jgi:hypothetical protein